MLDFSHIPTSTKADVQVFNASGNPIGASWMAYHKPRGASMLYILCIGSGGNGGNGAVGAASTAAGGGGGGSGAQSSLLIPAALLPNILYVYCTYPASNQTAAVSLAPNATANNLLITAGSGGSGGSASGATAGLAGAAVSAPSVGTNPICGLGFFTFIAGQAGIVGGTTSAGAALTLPTTGLLVTGGTGGAGVGNAASTGAAGGAFTVSGAFPPQPGGIAPGSQTVPAGNGSNGFDRVINGLSYSYGGTGGASTGGAATGAGLKAGNGGAGGIGCGGGGGGGGFTGSTQGLGGRGGPGQIIITAW